MTARIITRVVMAALLTLGLCAAPAVAHAAPGSGGDEGALSWRLVDTLREVWGAIWGAGERGPNIDPTSILDGRGGHLVAAAGAPASGSGDAASPSSLRRLPEIHQR